MSARRQGDRRSSHICPLAAFVAGLALLSLCLSLLIREWDVDMACARWWWHPSGHWFGSESVVCALLNDYGPLPATVIAVGAALAALAAWLRPSLRRMGPPAIYLMLAFLLGPGLLVNGVLKHTWGRARPKEVSTFGGKQRYDQVLINDAASSGRSFPSGHASAAFYLCSLGFASAAWGTRKSMYAGLWLGLAWGALVGWSRMASGAHFLSDVLWSAALVNAVNGGLLLAMSHWRPQRAAEPQTRPMHLAT